MSTPLPQRSLAASLLACRALDVAPYAPPPRDERIDLNLASNECPVPAVDVEAVLARIGAASLTRYPDASELESLLADRWGVERDRVLVTAGGDDAIDRLCRSILEPGRELIFPWPSFEMIERSAKAAGGTVVRTPWRSGAFPLERVLSLVNGCTAMIAVVSPNNPTGLTATPEELRCVASAAPRAVVMLDLAYAEFAGEEGEALMRAALELDNAVVVRTFSKAYGLAGLRVGYAIGPVGVIRAMRALGSPFPTSSIGLAAAAEVVRHGSAALAKTVRRVTEERSRLTELLLELGGSPTPSRGNFVLCEFNDPARVAAGLRSVGIAVRLLQLGMAGGDSALRITCPASESGYSRLELGLRAILKHEARVASAMPRFENPEDLTS